MPFSRRATLAAALLLFVAVMLGVAQSARAAGSVSLTALGTAYSQDFNTLASAGTSSTVPAGWDFLETGVNANTSYTAGTGSSNTGDTYSFGALASSERAFGGLQSGSLNPTIGAAFTNNTGSTITTLAVSYTGEQWRFGGTVPRTDRIDFQYSTDAASLNTGTWTNVDALDFSGPISTGTVGLLDGNSAANRTAVSASIAGLSIPAGASVWIRWASFDASGADDALAVDDFSLTPSSGDAAPEVTGTAPADGATNVDLTSNINVTFSEPVTVTGSWFTLSCGRSGEHTAAVSGGPTTFTLDPDSDFVDGDSCTLTLVGAQVTDQDGNDPPDAMASNLSVGFVAGDVCAAAYTPAYRIQGDSSAAAITGNVTTQGVVVGDFEGSSGLQGFYLQDTTGDGDAATSDGVFVFTGSSNTVSAGQVVRVSGFARERFNQTALNGSNSNTAPVAASSIVPCGTGGVAPANVTTPFPALDYPERFEGMLVRFPQALVISEYFNYERFGELVLALPLPGESRPFTGTAIDEPGAPALARAAANTLRRITLDDGLGIQNPSLLRHPNGSDFSLINRFRGGDSVQNTVGVMGFDFNLYRIQPTGPADYTVANPRPAAPEPVGGSLRVAAMNTLNFFLTLDYPTGDPLDNKCGPGQNVECRGADADQPAEFTRQRDKLLAALAGLGADIIGLNELENTPGVDPLGDPTRGIVPGLNAMLGAGTYAAISTGVIGTDAIRVGLIYKPAAVTPLGSFKLLTTAVDPRFLDTKNRPTLAQTFQVVATGARFTVVVNHLKSKGSDCNDVGDPDLGDGQGNCNQTRRAAAEALVDWLATDPTGSGDPDFLIMGDLNSYAQEDPIDAVKAGADGTSGTSDDYTNLIAHYQGPYAYSYVFDGQAGYLDHAFATRGLAAQATGATEWHINADEPDLLDYDTSFKPPAQDAIYEPNAFRSSDHDPVLVGLDLCEETPPTLSVGVSPTTLWPPNHRYRLVQATVTASDNSGVAPTVQLVSVTSNEPDDAAGDADGNTRDDVAIIDQDTFQLRGERSETGTGRVYTVKYQATDGCGNTTTASATVTVPVQS